MLLPSPTMHIFLRSRFMPAMRVPDVARRCGVRAQSSGAFARDVLRLMPPLYHACSIFHERCSTVLPRFLPAAVLRLKRRRRQSACLLPPREARSAAF